MPRIGVPIRKRGTRWHGDFRAYGDKQRALTWKLVGKPGNSRGTELRKEAVAIAEEYVRQLRSGRPGPTDSISTDTFESYLERHLAALQDRPKRNGEYRTERYILDTRAQLEHAGRFFGFDRPLVAVGPDQVADYLTRLHNEGRAPRTIEVYIRRLDAMMRRAEDERRIERNPVNAVRGEIPSGQRTRERRALEREEAWRLIQAAKTYDSETGHYLLPLASLFLHSGLRWSEAIGLAVGDISFEPPAGEPKHVSGEIHVRPNEWRRLKNRGSERRVPLWRDCAAILKPFVEGRDNSVPLFPSPVDPTRPVGDVRRAWSKVRERAGLPDWVDFHTLRHTYASHRIQTVEGGQPVSPFTVSRELGHSSSAMVEQCYGHLLENRSDRREEISFRPVQLVADSRTA